MAIYTASLACKTKSGGVEKKAQLWIRVEADSREEALVRMRSAAARVLSKPGAKDIGDHLLTQDEDGNTNGEFVPLQGPLHFPYNDGSPYTVTVGSSNGETLEQQLDTLHEAGTPNTALEEPLAVIRASSTNLGPHTVIGDLLFTERPPRT